MEGPASSSSRSSSRMSPSSSTRGSSNNNNTSSPGGGASGSGQYDDCFKRMMKLVNSLLQRQDCGPFREPVDWRGLELYDYPKIIKKMMDLGTVKRKLERKQYKTPNDCANDIRLVWTNCMTYNADGSDFWLLAKSFLRRFEDRYRRVRQEFDVGDEPAVPDASTSGSKADNSSSGGGAQSGGAQQSSSSGGGGNKAGSGGGSSGAGSDYATSPSLDIRAKFGANLFLLNAMELAHVIMKLELECPEALEQPTPITMTATTMHKSSIKSEEEEDETLPALVSSRQQYMRQRMMSIMEHNEQRMEINVDEIDHKLFNELNKYVNDKVGNKNVVPFPDVEVDDITANRNNKKRKR